MADDRLLNNLAAQLGQVRGIVGVVLGGSRARGEHTESSDYDLGLYYRQPLDTNALARLRAVLRAPMPRLLSPANGGLGSMVVRGCPSRAGPSIGSTAMSTASDGRGAMRSREDSASTRKWAIRSACQISPTRRSCRSEWCFDTAGERIELKRETQTYPPALSRALSDRLWEADFLLSCVRKSMARADVVWVAGCLFRVVLLCVHALHGHAGRWLINEKGALDSTERLSATPPGFVDRASDICGSTGSTPSDLARTLESAAELINTTRVTIHSTR